MWEVARKEIEKRSMEHQDSPKVRQPWYLSGKTEQGKFSSPDLDKKIKGMEAHIGRIRERLNQLRGQLRRIQDQLEQGEGNFEQDEVEHDAPFTGGTAIAN